MKKLLMVALLVLTIYPMSAAQETKLSSKEILQLPKQVLILRDGEQVVIRGNYEVSENHVYFYLDHGSYPTYSCVQIGLVDLESSKLANEQLMKERQRRQNYYRLIEERRRRLLEEANTRPAVVNVDEGTITVTEGESEGANQISREDFQNFQPYTDERVENRSENWWRDESERLFEALAESNKKMAEIASAHDALVIRYNQTRSQAEAQQLQEQIDSYQHQAAAERTRGQLIGNRLAELSEFAEKNAIPLEWIVPEGEIIFEEGSNIISNGDSADASDIEVTDYTAAELYNVPDSWWKREYDRLRIKQSQIESIISRVKDEYNVLVKERESAESEIKIRQLTKKIDATAELLRRENANLELTKSNIDKLIASAKELGKEEALGIIQESN